MLILQINVLEPWNHFSGSQGLQGPGLENPAPQPATPHSHQAARKPGTVVAELSWLGGDNKIQLGTETYDKRAKYG